MNFNPSIDGPVYVWDPTLIITGLTNVFVPQVTRASSYTVLITKLDMFPWVRWYLWYPVTFRNSVIQNGRGDQSHMALLGLNWPTEEAGYQENDKWNGWKVMQYLNNKHWKRSCFDLKHGAWYSSFVQWRVSGKVSHSGTYHLFLYAFRL